VHHRRTIVSDHLYHSAHYDLAELDRLCQKILLLENGIMQPEKIGINEQQLPPRFITLQMEPCGI